MSETPEIMRRMARERLTWLEERLAEDRRGVESGEELAATARQYAAKHEAEACQIRDWLQASEKGANRAQQEQVAHARNDA